MVVDARGKACSKTTGLFDVSGFARSTVSQTLRVNLQKPFVLIRFSIISAEALCQMRRHVLNVRFFSFSFFFDVCG